mmetsp:Transcript_1382/g.4756  ORF Transcript_1382/g.4756 Transcript_1382/m.4756 type:complete len:602 (-) Transcript_1382:119-1924(-)
MLKVVEWAGDMSIKLSSMGGHSEIPSGNVDITQCHEVLSHALKLREWMNTHRDARVDSASIFIGIWDHLKTISGGIGVILAAKEKEAQEATPVYARMQHDKFSPVEKSNIQIPQKKKEPLTQENSVQSLLPSSPQNHSLIPTFVASHRFPTFESFLCDDLLPGALILTSQNGNETLRFCFFPNNYVLQTKIIESDASTKPQGLLPIECKNRAKAVDLFKDLFRHETMISWDKRYSPTSQWHMDSSQQRRVCFLYSPRLRADSQYLFGYALSRALKNIKDANVDISIEELNPDNSTVRKNFPQYLSRFLVGPHEVKQSVSFSGNGGNYIFPTLATLAKEALDSPEGKPPQKVIVFTDGYDQSNMSTQEFTSLLNQLEQSVNQGSGKLSFHVVHLGTPDHEEPSFSEIPSFIDGKNLFKHYRVNTSTEMDTTMEEILSSLNQTLQHTNSMIASPFSAGSSSKKCIWVPDTNVISSESAIHTITQAINDGLLLSPNMTLGISFTVLCELDHAKGMKPIRKFARIVHEAHKNSPSFIHQESKNDFKQEMECGEIAVADDRILRFCDCLKVKHGYKRVILCTYDTMLTNKARSFDVEVYKLNEWQF